MASYNSVILVGNLTRDPETRNVGQSSIVAKLGIAINKRHKDQSGEWREKAVFIDVETWGQSATFARDYLRKGSSVLIDGELDVDTWQDKQSGANRSRMYVKAYRIHALDKPAQSPRNAPNNAPRTPTPPAFPGAPTATQPPPASAYDGTPPDLGDPKDDIPF